MICHDCGKSFPRVVMEFDHINKKPPRCKRCSYNDSHQIIKCFMCGAEIRDCSSQNFKSGKSCFPNGYTLRAYSGKHQISFCSRHYAHGLIIKRKFPNGINNLLLSHRSKDEVIKYATAEHQLFLAKRKLSDFHKATRDIISNYTVTFTGWIRNARPSREEIIMKHQKRREDERRRYEENRES